MQFIKGVMHFSDLQEMYYNLFCEIGIAINNNNYLYDVDTGVVLRYKDKYIKTTTRPFEVVYAGKNDILFEPMKNFNLMKCLFGYYIDKTFADKPGYYIADFIEDDATYSAQRVVVRTSQGDIESPFYNNVYLAFCHCIFIIGGLNVSLEDFDLIIGV